MGRQYLCLGRPQQESSNWSGRYLLVKTLYFDLGRYTHWLHRLGWSGYTPDIGLGAHILLVQKSWMPI